MSEQVITSNPYSGVIREISAAEERTLDERGVPVRMGRQYRRDHVATAGYDADKHTVELTLTSEAPVERYYGVEKLSHAKGAIRTERLKNGISLLFNHNYDALLGRSVSYKTPDGGPLSLVYGFGPSALSQEKEAEVAARVLQDTSGGYLVHEWEITEDKNGVRTYLAVDWEPLEGSLVTVPADPKVGVGRGMPVKYTLRKLGEDGTEIERKRYAFDPELNATRSIDDDSTEDDEDEDDEAERIAAAATAAAAEAEAARSAAATTTTPADPAATSERTTISEGQRTHTMADETTAGVDLVAQKAARDTQLRTLHTQHPTEFNQRALEAAVSLDADPVQVKARIFDAIITASQRHEVPTVADEVFEGMTATDLSRYSVAGAFRAAANLARPGTYRGKELEGGFEREVSQTLAAKASERGIQALGSGITIPSSTTRALARAQAERTIASGGNAGTATNFTTVDADPIELLRPACVLLKMGARMLTGLHGAIQMTTQTGAGQSNWELEGGTVPETDPTLGFFTMKPNRLSMYNNLFRDFLAQSNLAIESFLAEDRRRVLAIALDSAGLAGSGTAPVPLGIMNRTGLAAVLAGSVRNANGTVTAGAGGVPMTFVDWNNLQAVIDSANGIIGTLGCITTPRIKAAARSTPKIPGTASEFCWPSSTAPDSNGVETGPLGMPSCTTTNPALQGFTANGVSGLQAALVGVYNQLLFGDWGLSELIVDPYTGAQQALLKFTEHGYFDCNVRQLPAFALCASALPS